MIINHRLSIICPAINKPIINFLYQNLSFLLIVAISVNKYYGLKLFFFCHHLHNDKEQSCISFFHFYQKLLDNLNFCPM